VCALPTPDQRVAERLSLSWFHKPAETEVEETRSESEQPLIQNKIYKVFKTSRVSFKSSLFTSEEMDSGQQEEQKPVKMEFIEDYSESDPDEEPLRVKLEETEQQTGWCYSRFFINDAVKL